MQMHHGPQSAQPAATPLILIGGSVRAAAVDAARAGYRLIAIDRFGDRDLRAVCQSWHRWERQQDWVRLADRWPTAPLIPTGGFTGCPCDDLRRDRLVAFPTPDKFAAICDPQRLHEVAEHCAIEFPKTLSADGTLAEREHAWARSAPTSGDWLIKPRLGTGGIGIRRWRSGAAPGLAPPGPQQDLQQWVAGRPLGVSYFARHRRGQRITRLLGACEGLTHRKHRQWPWLYGGSLGPCRLSAACRDVLMRIGQQVATAFGLVGLFNVDLVRRRDNSLVLLEINPRYSASMELLRIKPTSAVPDPVGAPVSLIHWHLAAYQEDSGRIDTEAADKRTGWLGTGQGWTDEAFDDAGAELACKRIVYAAGPMRVDQSACELSRMIAEIPGLQVSFHDLPADGETIAAGHPALTIILRGAVAPATLVQVSQRIAAHLRRRLRLR